MSDAEPTKVTAQDSGLLRASEAVSVEKFPSITTSRAEGDQSFSLAQGELALRGEEAARQHEIHVADQHHKHEQEREDNKLRRACVRVVVGLLVAAFVAAFLVGFFAAEPSTRQWAQGVFTTLIGGLVGGVAGYFTGKSNA